MSSALLASPSYERSGNARKFNVPPSKDESFASNSSGKHLTMHTDCSRCMCTKSKHEVVLQ
ncbi:hypothetical protein CPSG_09373 [Coccidioides posadasii str. Silveira]|uniref:Uncharacterized protein n=1 Tax=Coccidioides posadasii (strain RMSCC 757 / Silveira) TaxID=443226 RepID=E9DHS4_COCPS|nr:hypothetical protein CPSG_09373 [Coccidioides posadasii str. Silveira]